MVHFDDPSDKRASSAPISNVLGGDRDCGGARDVGRDGRDGGREVGRDGRHGWDDDDDRLRWWFGRAVGEPTRCRERPANVNSSAPACNTAGED